MTLVIEKAETGSTNDDAKNLAIRGAPNFTVVWAHKQTAGRGTRERQWISSEGNVFWSIILRPSRDWRNFTDIVYVNALAVHRTVADAIGESDHLQLKWPNDLLLNGKKVAGSMLESGGIWSGGLPEWIVIGTGINVLQRPDIPDIRYPPTSIFHEGFQSVRRDALIANLHTNLEMFMGIWTEKSFTEIKSMYLRHAHNLNKEIRVGLSHNKDEYRDGIYRGIDETGRLILERHDGVIDLLHSAEIR
jgi:BirA family biotin operon repressor/biotin-[acetyl-CoA-carboxylase] ligase